MNQRLVFECEHGIVHIITRHVAHRADPQEPLWLVTYDGHSDVDVYGLDVQGSALMTHWAYIRKKEDERKITAGPAKDWLVDFMAMRFNTNDVRTHAPE